jgi:hypothetical protein
MLWVKSWQPLPAAPIVQVMVVAASLWVMANVIEPSRTAVAPERATVKLETVPPATNVVSQGLADGVHGPETELNHVAAGFENTVAPLLFP